MKRKRVKRVAGKAAKGHQKVRKFADALKRPRKAKRGQWRIVVGGSPPKWLALADRATQPGRAWKRFRRFHIWRRAFSRSRKYLRTNLPSRRASGPPQTRQVISR